MGDPGLKALRGAVESAAVSTRLQGTEAHGHHDGGHGQPWGAPLRQESGVVIDKPTQRCRAMVLSSAVSGSATLTPLRVVVVELRSS
ncbi:hypothetical protein PC116_g10117 [Phytophthora cactorum]|uniref:Uncharacterized protein n=1 Tax=Phytophthora cactorum TaxID=29920 RepID=A0A8T1L2S0_9STRA|nr:hypothetical protein Pcac1_g6601 [Phytophthora cactorum]KAG2916865.1 hypothetical protein PC114_g7363 [Phytophthora cactorum]KAG2946857.1 hypothetical protein PC117_g7321 [Phytophthora cactorum]KAG3028501.1 hypothetical protein PC119_g7000 [Phytophthora cactorum]KAG3175217.1 hypothetical protein C6341_g9564 [Phytophthora cactorum]